MSFTKKIIVSMILGILIGITINLTSLLDSSPGIYVINLLDLVSYLFLSSLKLIIVPLIFFSIVCGIVSLSDDVSISRLGIKTLLLYTITTVIAISLGLLFSSFINYEPIEMENLNSAINIEQNIIKENVGSQDQTNAAFGGFNHIEFLPGDKIVVEPIILAKNKVPNNSTNRIEYDDITRKY